MEKILYINSCIRENSRTNYLAKYLLSKLKGDITELVLDNTIKPLDLKSLERRDYLLANKEYNAKEFDLANMFKSHDVIVIASPYYDLSFSALLKNYFENINCVGLTFGYNDKGMPYSMSKAKKLYYVTTAGGYILNDDFGFGYIKALANTFYEIKDIKYIKAEGLDIVGADVLDILNKAKEKIDTMEEK